MGTAAGGLVAARLLGVGDFGSPGLGPAPAVLPAEDLSGIIHELRAAAGGCLVAVCGPDDAPAARRAVHLARTAVGGAPGVVHVSPLPPLGRQVLLSMAAVLAGSLGAGEVVAALPLLERRLMVVAAVGGVTRLERPAPGLALHAFSWLHAAGFVVAAWPVGAVRRFRRKGLRQSDLPALPPELPADPAGRVLIIAGRGRRATAVADALIPLLAAGATIPHEPSPQARGWWGTGDAVELCLAPLDLAETAAAARDACAACPWCTEPAPPGRCPGCGHVTAGGAPAPDPAAARPAAPGPAPRPPSGSRPRAGPRRSRPLARHLRRARPRRLPPMNPRQRRGLLTLLVSALGAVTVFLGVASYVGQIRSQVGPMAEVYVAAHQIAPYAAVMPADVKQVAIPAKYVTASMVVHEQDFLGYKSATAIEQGAWLQRDLLVPASSIGDGQREISVNLDADQGINGRIRPGDVVDVVAAFAAANDSAQVSDPSVRRAKIPYNIAGVIVRNAHVVSVGSRTPVGVNVGDAQEGNTNPQAIVPVTFAVSVAEATRLAYAEAFSVSLRLMRSGNNETGTKVKDSDLSFGDTGLPKVLMPGGSPSAGPAPSPSPSTGKSSSKSGATKQAKP